MLTKGSKCAITRDITVSGKVIFKAGESVVVEKVSPNRSRPEYKYVVRSLVVNKRFQLPTQDLLELKEEPPVYGDVVIPEQPSTSDTFYHDAEERPIEEEPPSTSMGFGGCVLAFIAIATLGFALYLGIDNGGWVGGVVAFVIWVVFAGATAQGFNIASAGEASREYLRRTKRK